MKRIYIREEVCIGCHLCEMYCRFQHSASTDLIKAFKRYPDPPVSRTNVEESGVISLSLRCQHCDESPCFFACLTGALSRNPISDAIVVDSNKCIGCWTCMLACPFGALKQDIDNLFQQGNIHIIFHFF